MPLAPIIVTAQMGAADQAWADRLRAAHYPPERNRLAAHITLFHHLPPSLLPEIADRLRVIVRDPLPEAWLADVMSLGNGVAFRIESPALIAMRGGLSEAFHGLLTPQDSATPRFHITVQNKVDARIARALLGKLAAEFAPRPLAIAGLAAWHYRGGPWELAWRGDFRG